MSDSSTTTKSAEETFQEEQAAAAAEQGLGAGSVPERRPQAFQEVPESQESELHKRRVAAGEFDPPTKADYDRANSDAQAKKAAKAERKLGLETLREGTKVKVTKGIYEGAIGVITEVTFKNQEEAQKFRSGDPSVARFAKASQYLVRSRGGAHALMSVTPEEIEIHNGPLGANVSKI